MSERGAEEKKKQRGRKSLLKKCRAGHAILRTGKGGKGGGLIIKGAKRVHECLSAFLRFRGLEESRRTNGPIGECPSTRTLKK